MSLTEEVGTTTQHIDTGSVSGWLAIVTAVGGFVVGVFMRGLAAGKWKADLEHALTSSRGEIAELRADVEKLTAAVHTLNVTMARLSTQVDERTGGHGHHPGGGGA